jgi:1-acyl-sn-glycerol-3-phosphate acyltransferase
MERTMKKRAVANRDAPARRFDPDRDGWWDDYRYEIDPDFADLHARVARHRSATTVRSIPTRPSLLGRQRLSARPSNSRAR